MSVQNGGSEKGPRGQRYQEGQGLDWLLADAVRRIPEYLRQQAQNVEAEESTSASQD